MAFEKHVVDCLEIQERIDAVHTQARMTNPKRIADLGYANPYDGPDEVVLQAISAALAEERSLGMQYTPYGGLTVTRRRVARMLSGAHRLEYRWKDIVLTPGAMAALNMLFRLARTTDSAAEVIVVTPCWLDYPVYLANLGVKAVFVPVLAGSFALDIKAIRAAISDSTRALILSQPANPSGVRFTDKELHELGEVLTNAPTRPLLISDECHRDFVFEGQELAVPAQHYDDVCTVYSFGKSLLIQGQRIGFVATSPRHRQRAAVANDLERACRVMGFATPTALMQRALPRLLSHKLDVRPVQRRRERLISALSRAGYEVSPGDATLFVYMKTPGDEFEFLEALAARGVLVLPGALFSHAGYLRLSATASDEMVERAIAVFEDLAPSP